MCHCPHRLDTTYHRRQSERAHDTEARDACYDVASDACSARRGDEGLLDSSDISRPTAVRRPPRNELNLGIKVECCEMPLCLTERLRQTVTSFRSSVNPPWRPRRDLVSEDRAKIADQTDNVRWVHSGLN